MSFRAVRLKLYRVTLVHQNVKVKLALRTAGLKEGLTDTISLRAVVSSHTCLARQSDQLMDISENQSCAFLQAKTPKIQVLLK